MTAVSGPEMGATNVPLNATTDSPDETEHYSNTWVIIVGTTLACIAMSTIIGNLLVILSYLKDHRIRSSVGNLYVLNRAVADMVVGTLVIPFATASLLIGEWPFGDLFCKIWTVIESSAAFVSVLSLLLISLDRYWLVTKKLRYSKFQTQQRAAVLICGCWMLCVTLYGISVFVWRFITGVDFEADLITECRIQSRNNIYYALILFLVQFILPVVLIAGLNRVVYTRIRQRSRSFVQSSSPVPIIPKTKESQVAQEQPNVNNLNNVQNSEDEKRRQTDAASAMRCMDEVNGVSLVSIRTLPPKDTVIKIAVDRDTERSSSPEVTIDNTTLDTQTEETVVDDYKKSTCRKPPKTLNLQSPKTAKVKRHRKAGVTLVILVSVYVACWLPYCLVLLLNSGCKDCIPRTAILITRYLHWCISTINPFLYAVLNDKYRTSFAKLLGFSRCQSKKNNVSHINNRKRKLNFTASAASEYVPSPTKDTGKRWLLH